jgi:hypothetical protein
MENYNFFSNNLSVQFIIRKCDMVFVCWEVLEHFHSFLGLALNLVSAG